MTYHNSAVEKAAQNEIQHLIDNRNNIINFNCTSSFACRDGPITKELTISYYVDTKKTEQGPKMTEDVEIKMDMMYTALELFIKKAGGAITRENLRHMSLDKLYEIFARNGVTPTYEVHKHD